MFVGRICCSLVLALAAFARADSPHVVSARVGDGLAGGRCGRALRAGVSGHAKPEATEVYTHVTLTKLKAVYEACHPGARAATPVATTAVPTVDEVLEALEDEAGEEDGG
ncbi:MAG: hypothetical protein AMXMBFR34_17520 [Myxococcaceae bacterium]